MIVDELECFKMAAELGCARFRNGFPDGDSVNFPPEYHRDDGGWQSLYGLSRAASGLSDINGRAPELPQVNGSIRVIQSAVSICVEWWRERKDKFYASENMCNECEVMMTRAREFGVKYGTPR